MSEGDLILELTLRSAKKECRATVMLMTGEDSVGGTVAQAASKSVFGFMLEHAGHVFPAYRTRWTKEEHD
jgi:hypothetical protein